MGTFKQLDFCMWYLFSLKLKLIKVCSCKITNNLIHHFFVWRRLFLESASQVSKSYVNWLTRRVTLEKRLRTGSSHNFQPRKCLLLQLASDIGQSAELPWLEIQRGETCAVLAFLDLAPRSYPPHYLHLFSTQDRRIRRLRLGLRLALWFFLLTQKLKQLVWTL